MYRGFIVALSLLAACGPTFDDGGGADDDAGPEVRLPPQQGPDPFACGTVPVTGECQGDVAVYCNAKEDELRQKDCGLMGKTCGVEPDKGAVCLSSAAEGCPDGLTIDGECDENGNIRYCDGNDTVQIWECFDEQVCSMDQFGMPGCLTPSEEPASSECAELGGQGACTTATALKYCIGDTLYEEFCDSGDSCSLDTEGYAFCNPGCGDITVDGQCDGNTLSYCLNAGTPEELFYSYECDEGLTCQDVGNYFDCQ